MQYQLVYNDKGERLWIPLLAGAAIISAPLWLNKNNCCNNQYPIYQPYPVYQQQLPYPYPYPYPVNYSAS
jgi:hypothetical protein